MVPAKFTSFTKVSSWGGRGIADVQVYAIFNCFNKKKETIFDFEVDL